MPTNFELNEEEKLKSKKPASSHTDNFGKTTYYDEQGNYMEEGFTNAFEKQLTQIQQETMLDKV